MWGLICDRLLCIGNTFFIFLKMYFLLALCLVPHFSLSFWRRFRVYSTASSLLPCARRSHFVTPRRDISPTHSLRFFKKTQDVMGEDGLKRAFEALFAAKEKDWEVCGASKWKRDATGERCELMGNEKAAALASTDKKSVTRILILRC